MIQAFQLILTPPLEPGPPTLLISEPEQVGSGLPTGGRPSWVYTCDNRCEYTGPALAMLIGIGHKQLIARIKMYGWWSRKVLQTKEAAQKERMAATKARRAAELLHASGGTEEYLALSGLVRSRNLRKIRPAGSWEQKGAGHERRGQRFLVGLERPGEKGEFAEAAAAGELGAAAGW